MERWVEVIENTAMQLATVASIRCSKKACRTFALCLSLGFSLCFRSRQQNMQGLTERIGSQEHGQDMMISIRGHIQRTV